MLKKTIEAKKIISNYEKVLIAFSGGVDSLFLLKLAVETLGCERVLAVTVKSPLSISDEVQRSAELSSIFRVEHKIVELNELTVKQVANNLIDRCYHCKKFRYEKLLEISHAQGCGVVLDGTNYSDINDYRPGLQACEELGIISPLKHAEFTKSQIRELLRAEGFSQWNLPSRACLASRIAYGNQITLDLLQRVSSAEDFLNKKGFTDQRVRVHGDIARIELPQKDIMLLLKKEQLLSEIVSKLKGYGFKFVTIDLEGLRSGSLNPDR